MNYKDEFLTFLFYLLAELRANDTPIDVCYVGNSLRRPPHGNNFERGSCGSYASSPALLGAITWPHHGHAGQR